MAFLKKCAFCHVKRVDVEPGVIVHWFRWPKTEERFIWATALIDLDPDWADVWAEKEKNTSMHICSLHFNESDYAHRGTGEKTRSYLHRGAVPSKLGPKLYEKCELLRLVDASYGCSCAGTNTAQKPVPPGMISKVNEGPTELTTEKFNQLVQEILDSDAAEAEKAAECIPSDPLAVEEQVAEDYLFTNDHLYTNQGQKECSPATSKKSKKKRKSTDPTPSLAKKATPALVKKPIKKPTKTPTDNTLVTKMTTQSINAKVFNRIVNAQTGLKLIANPTVSKPLPSIQSAGLPSSTKTTPAATSSKQKKKTQPLLDGVVPEIIGPVKKTASHKIYVAEDGKVCYLTQDITNQPITRTQLKTAQIVALQTAKKMGCTTECPPKMILVRNTNSTPLSRKSIPLLNNTKVFKLMFVLDDPPEEPLDLSSGNTIVNLAENDDPSTQVAEFETIALPDILGTISQPPATEKPPEKVITEIDLCDDNAEETHIDKERVTSDSLLDVASSCPEPEAENGQELQTENILEPGPAAVPEPEPAPLLEPEPENVQELEPVTVPEATLENTPDAKKSINLPSESSPTTEDATTDPLTPIKTEPVETDPSVPTLTTQLSSATSSQSNIPGLGKLIQPSISSSKVALLLRKGSVASSTPKKTPGKITTSTAAGGPKRTVILKKNLPQAIKDALKNNTLVKIVQAQQNSSLSNTIGDSSKPKAIILEKGTSGQILQAGQSANKSSSNSPNVQLLIVQPNSSQSSSTKQTVVLKGRPQFSTASPNKQGSSAGKSSGQAYKMVQIVHPNANSQEVNAASLSNSSPVAESMPDGFYSKLPLLKQISNYLNNSQYSSHMSPYLEKRPVVSEFKELRVLPSDISQIIQLTWQRALNYKNNNITPGIEMEMLVSYALADSVRVCNILGPKKTSVLEKMASKSSELRKGAGMRRLERKVKFLEEKMEKMKTHNQTLNKKLRAARRRAHFHMTSREQMKEKIKLLEDPQIILKNELEDRLSPLGMQILNRLFDPKGDKQSYSPEIKQLCLRMQGASPMSYIAIQKVFSACLPCIQTVQKWKKELKPRKDSTKDVIDQVAKGNFERNDNSEVMDFEEEMECTSEIPQEVDHQNVQFILADSLETQSEQVLQEEPPRVQIQWSYPQTSDGKYTFGDQDMTVLIDVIQEQERLHKDSLH